ncbi:hypothetical protein HYU08_02250, partial [Candidatus Woesearchaeota archaeon]|nr:hypothetical protein [Candidatus Woesearchaeota archaeon]
MSIINCVSQISLSGFSSISSKIHTLSFRDVLGMMIVDGKTLAIAKESADKALEA